MCVCVYVCVCVCLCVYVCVCVCVCVCMCMTCFRQLRGPNMILEKLIVTEHFVLKAVNLYEKAWWINLNLLLCAVGWIKGELVQIYNLRLPRNVKNLHERQRNSSQGNETISFMTIWVDSFSVQANKQSVFSSRGLERYFVHKLFSKIQYKHEIYSDEFLGMPSEISLQSQNDL
jgi:hypothetical protein